MQTIISIGAKLAHCSKYLANYLLEQFLSNRLFWPLLCQPFNTSSYYYFIMTLNAGHLICTCQHVGSGTRVIFVHEVSPNQR